MKGIIVSIGLCILLLAESCSRVVSVQTSDSSASSFQVIMERSLRDITGLSSYDTAMKSGSEFLYILNLGLPFSYGELSFTNLTGDSLTRTPEQIEKAYRFSKLVNKLYVFEDGMMQALAIDDLGALNTNISQSKLTSALYDDDFYLTFVPPFGVDGGQSWNDVKMNMRNLAYFNTKSSKIKYPVRSYELLTEVMILDIERPWLKLSDVKKTGKAAIVAKIILAQHINITSYAGSTAKIKIRNQRAVAVQKQKPTLRIHTEGPVVIGYCLLML